MTDLSVVIVNWNAGDELRACLESIRANPPNGTYEVIVVDNASTDSSAAIARESFPDATWILNRHNRGLAAANNQGLIASTGTTIVISNPDVQFFPGALEAFQTALERHPDVGLVVGRVLLPDGRVQTTAGNLPTLLEALLGREHQRRKRNVGQPRGFCWDGWSHDEERMVGRAGDACYAARRSMIAQVGLFDERFPLDWEAIDWSHRATTAGWRILFTPRAQIRHEVSTSTSKAARSAWIFGTHRGMYRYFANRSSRRSRPLLAVIFAVRALVKLAWNAWQPASRRSKRSASQLSSIVRVAEGRRADS